MGKCNQEFYFFFVWFAQVLPEVRRGPLGASKDMLINGGT